MKNSTGATLLLFTLLAACGQKEESNGEVGTLDLAGIYLGDGEGAQQDRVCMVTDTAEAIRFGIVTLETNRAACSGIGRVERSDTKVSLIMAGDVDCAIDAEMEGTRVTFPATVPDGCSYYCSPAATLAGKAFEKTGDTAEDALRASDLVGNPLCI